MRRALIVSGVPVKVFAREVGLPLKDLIWLAGREGRKLEGEPTKLWERVMSMMNNKLGEILHVRAEIERREERVRRKKVAARRG